MIGSRIDSDIDSKSLLGLIVRSMLRSILGRSVEIDNEIYGEIDSETDRVRQWFIPPPQHPSHPKGGRTGKEDRDDEEGVGVNMMMRMRRR